METNIKQKVGLNFTHNKMELITDNDCEIVHEDGKWYVIRKKEKYPKTYKECCDVLGLNTMANNAQWYKADLIIRFQELLIVRDAYWKIAEDWKPDWKESSEKYSLVNCGGAVQIDLYRSYSQILSFPTAEMRDAFYENFKELIESCKELL